MRVALEEHFILPALLEYLAKGMPRASRVSYDRLIEKLSDFGEERLAAMDGAGVSVAVLSRVRSRRSGRTGCEPRGQAGA